jgi:alkylated DNA repair dioxygenase AlkB
LHPANFGETRKFQLRHIETKKKLEIELKHGKPTNNAGELQLLATSSSKSTKPLKKRI